MTWDIHQYNQITDSYTGYTQSWKQDWCPGCTTSNTNILGGSLWNELYNVCGTGSQCADQWSYGYGNSFATVNNFHYYINYYSPSLLVFVGHHESIREWNNSISPTVPFTVWVPWDTTYHQITSYYSGYWTATLVGQGYAHAWQDWGTVALPLYYHQRGTEDPNTTAWSIYRSKGIWDAEFGSQTPVQPGGVCWGLNWLGNSENAYCANSGTTAAASYGVQYMYNANTSVLIGQDYQTGTWYSENTVDQATPNSRSGQLGSQGVKWYIADGCNLVTVARYATMNSNSGSVVATDKGRQQWMKSWSTMHMVLGHYAESESDCMPNMITVADNLASGLDVVDSYFNAHNAPWSNCHDPSHAGFAQASVLGPDGNILWNDTWTSPMADPTSITGAWTMYYEAAQ